MNLIERIKEKKRMRDNLPEFDMMTGMFLQPDYFSLITSILAIAISLAALIMKMKL